MTLTKDVYYGDFLSGYFYELSEVIEPGLYYCGITPNMITISRFGLILATVPLVNWGYSLLAAPLVLTSYFCDCLDGHYARRYHMVSLIGDYLDHAADVVGYIVLFYILFPVLWPHRLLELSVLLFLTLTTAIEVSCEDRLKWQTRQLTNSDVLSEANCSLRFIHRLSELPMMSKDMRQNLSVLRYFGPGTMFLYLSFLIGGGGAPPPPKPPF